MSIESVEKNLLKLQENLNSNLLGVQDILQEQITEINGLINDTSLNDLLSSKKIPSTFRVTGSSCNLGIFKDYDYEADPDFAATDNSKVHTTNPTINAVVNNLKWAHTVENTERFWSSGVLLDSNLHILVGDNSYLEALWDDSTKAFTFDGGPVKDVNGLNTIENIHRTLNLNYKKSKSFNLFLDSVGKDNMLLNLDDHDYGLNNNFGDYQFKSHYMKANKDFYYDVLGLTRPTNSPQLTADEGHYYSKDVAFNNLNIQVLVLDVHSFSTNNSAGVFQPADATYFGETQWTWLETKLSEKADVRIITMGPAIFFTKSLYSDDNGISAFPFEQQRLINLIRKTKANGCVFMSGDSHAGLLFVSGPDTPYKMYNIHTPSLDHTRTGDPSGGDRLAVKNYPPVVSDLKQQTGYSCIDIIDTDGTASGAYLKIGHRRLYGMGCEGKEPNPLLQDKFIGSEPEILVPLSELTVTTDVPDDFNWKTDYTTFPLTNSTKLATENFSENRLITDVNEPDTPIANLTLGGSTGF